MYYCFKALGEATQISLEKSQYAANDHLAIRIYLHNEGYTEFWGMLTNNVKDTDITNERCAYIREDATCDYLEFIAENKLGKPTGRIAAYGHDAFREVKFSNTSWLKCQTHCRRCSRPSVTAIGHHLKRKTAH